MDGWLTVGAGRRVTDVQDLDADDEPDRYCREIPEPIELPDGGAAVPGWGELERVQDEQTFDTQLGLLGDRVAEAQSCTTAVGPGAVLALARGDGVVANYTPDPATADDRAARELSGDGCRPGVGSHRRANLGMTRRRRWPRTLGALRYRRSMLL